MIGRRLGPYEIEKSLGAGGMGEVFAARDTRLGRRIAIKILTAEFARDPERRARFEREAQAIAALEHAGIVTVYAVEEIDGVHFITMQLVDGQPLSGSIVEGGMPLHRFFDIAIPLADAIAAAHQRGVTHRDLKPGNVMLTREGRPMVLDFGLAKLADRNEQLDRHSHLPTERLTEEGTILGTVSYMSPEQAEGRTVDARTDIFSLGVVFYEMLTGDLPFKGDTKISVISAIVKDTPRPVTDINRALPRHLGRIIRRALEKSPERRYQSAQDLRNDLQGLQREIESGEHEVDAAVGPGAGEAAPLPALPATGMPGREKVAWTLVAVLAAFLGVAYVTGWLAPAPSVAPQRLRLGTGASDGVYFPIGEGIARILEREMAPLIVEVVETDGSFENAERLDRGDLDLALMQNDIAFRAVKTERVLGHRSEQITGLAMLFEEVLQVLARRDAAIAGIEGLRGKTVNLDRPASGSRVASELLLEHFGISLQDIDPRYLTITEIEPQMLAGEADASMWWRALPAPFVRDLFLTGKFELVPIAPELIAGLRASQPFLTPVIIPPLTYPGQNEGVSTVAAKAMLTASRSLDEATVHDILAALFANIPDLIAHHPRAADVSPESAYRLDDGMVIDLHPGAERYWNGRR